MLTKISNYEPSKSTVWQGRKDSLPNERFFQKTECIDIRKHPIPEAGKVLLGFCSDEGIKRNLGRTGANLGPNSIRQQLGKLALHHDTSFTDIGNIVCQNEDLETAQSNFAKLISFCHQHSKKTIALGGGHEIAWPHFQGLSQHYCNIGIINFDAHFDLRTLGKDNRGTSGTPFTQIKNYCDNNHMQFNYSCLGIQPGGNTHSLFTNAKEFGVDYLTAEQIRHHNEAENIKFLDNFLKRCNVIYLTICMDVFAECFAPGVSAPQSLGLYPTEVLPLLKYILQTGKVISIDVAELSPPLDSDNKTSRLAANLIAEILNTNPGF